MADGEAPALVGAQVQIHLILGQTAEGLPVIAVNGAIVSGDATQPISAEEGMVYMLRAVTKHLEALNFAQQQAATQILLPTPQMLRI
jgi:hypothetical protein